MDGNLVFRQNVGDLEPGEHRFAWSGQDMDGNQMPVDRYQVTASAGGGSICCPRFDTRDGEQRLNPAIQQLDLNFGDNFAEIQTIANNPEQVNVVLYFTNRS